jgi:hypothetical protein
MSAVPQITQQILDGGLGIPASTPQLLHVKVGISSAGVRNKARLQTDVGQFVTTNQAGPLVTGGGFHIQRAGSFWSLRTNTSNPGSIGAVTKTPGGTGTGTLSAGLSTYIVHAPAAPGAPLSLTNGFVRLPIPGKLTISLAAPGVATNYTVIGKDLEGNILPPEIIALAAAPSTALSVNEYTEIISITSNVNPTGVTSFTTVQTTPVDAYEMIVEVMTSGSVAAQTMQFRYSMDNGRSFSPTMTINAGGVHDLQTYAPGGSNNPYLGFKITFVDGIGPDFFLRGDKFTFETQAPTWSLIDLLTALDAVANDPDVRQLYSGFHVVGAADGTIYSSVESQLATYADIKYQYRFGYLEAVRQGATLESTWAAAVVASFNVTGVRTGVVAMDMNIDDPTTRTFPRRNFGSVYVARLMSCPISELPSHVDCETVYGIKTNLEGVSKLYQGDNSVATLTFANIVTARTYPTRLGFYITKSLIKTTDTSDYLTITNRRVMDVAATVGYDAALPFLQASLLADPSTGRLAQAEANKVKSVIEGKLSIVLEGGSRRHVSGLRVNVSTLNPFLQDRTLNTDIRIVPRGAVDFINQVYSYAPELT